ncbi:MAG: prephenate dehydrogenase/arogenate dehydrogenase family protein, partial [Phaeodactylibacter sp.]|nr:prephenate dehydrogenase/arogenate dehydrogenase family protein [Phaeodactylibacter sp.]
MERTIAIVGVGHIGGSMAISLKESGFAKWIIGVDPNQESLDKALRRRIIDEALPMSAAIERSDIILVATPVDAMLEVLPLILAQVEHQVVLEVGSTKKKILDAVERLPKRGRFVATHPMAGTEYSGIEAAIPDLFARKFTVLSEVEKSDPDAVETAKALYEALDMQLVYLDGDAHDLHAAYVSHISHISAFALALTVLEKE